MTASPENQRLEAECQLRLVRFMDTYPRPDNEIDMWIEGFWAAVEAMRHVRPIAEVQADIELRRALQARIT